MLTRAACLPPLRSQDLQSTPTGASRPGSYSTCLDWSFGCKLSLVLSRIYWRKNMSKQGHPATTSESRTQTPSRLKQPYHAPRLSVYGDLGQLTRGGTKGNSEQNVLGPMTRA